VNRRRAVRALLIAVFALLLASAGGLAQNAASSSSKWPGYLDLIRQHPWLSMAIFVALGIVLLFFEPPWRREVDQGPETPEPPSQPIDLRGAVFRDQVFFAQGEVQLANGRQTSDESQRAADPQVEDRQSASPSVVLYSLTSFLDNGDWEERVLSAAEAAASGAICVQFTENNSNIPNVSAIVIIFSAGQFDVVKKRARGKLIAAKNRYPRVPVILVAAGLSSEPVTEQDGHGLIAEAGNDVDHVRFLICKTEDEFQSTLTSKIRVLITQKIMQSRLEEAHQDSSESRDGND
jgi:hypothetical protein